MLRNLYVDDEPNNLSLNNTGVDVAIEPLKDLNVTTSGDLELIYGNESIKTALLRRISTPINGYSRYVRTYFSYEFIDANYGTELFDYLSYPIASSNLNDILKTVENSASQEQRVNILNVEEVSFQSFKSQLNLNLTYEILNSDAIEQLDLTLEL